MKTQIILLLLIPCFLNAQFSAQMRGGMNIDYKQPFLAPALDFSAHGIHLTPELIINAGEDKPVDMGVKLSYEYFLRDELSIQGGGGYYFDLYSMDAYDKYKNGVKWLGFVSVNYRSFFFQYDYINGSNFSIGFREVLFQNN